MASCSTWYVKHQRCDRRSPKTCSKYYDILLGASRTAVSGNRLQFYSLLCPPKSCKVERVPSARCRKACSHETAQERGLVSPAKNRKMFRVYPASQGACWASTAYQNTFWSYCIFCCPEWSEGWTKSGSSGKACCLSCTHLRNWLLTKTIFGVSNRLRCSPSKSKPQKAFKRMLQ